MRREPVESSAVDSIGYDSLGQLLEVEYKGGEVYHYFEVPPQEHQALTKADSIGAYMSQVIKRRYRYRKAH